MPTMSALCVGPSPRAALLSKRIIQWCVMNAYLILWCCSALLLLALCEDSLIIFISYLLISFNSPSLLSSAIRRHPGVSGWGGTTGSAKCVVQHRCSGWWCRYHPTCRDGTDPKGLCRANARTENIGYPLHFDRALCYVRWCNLLGRYQQRGLWMQCRCLGKEYWWDVGVHV